jgi:hypothetical protein
LVVIEIVQSEKPAGDRTPQRVKSGVSIGQ